MADFRFGSIGHPGGGYRFGEFELFQLQPRMAVLPAGNIRPGDTVTVSLWGSWASTGKAVTLSGNALDVVSETAASVTFVIPVLHLDPGFSLFNYGVAYPLEVSDSEGEASQLMAVMPPATPAFWFIPALSGHPWGPGSLAYNSQNLGNGDSLLVEVLSGGPINQVSVTGDVAALDTVSLRAKGYNSAGWGDWGIVQVVDASEIGDVTPPTVVSASVNEAGDTLTIQLSEIVYGNDGFSLSSTESPVSITYVSGSETDTRSFSTSRMIAFDELLSLSFVGTAIEDAFGNRVQPFSVFLVTNNSAFLPAPSVIRQPGRVTSIVGSPFHRDFSGNFRYAASIAIVAGQLPAGLTLSGGVVSGTPTTEQELDGIVLRAANASGSVDANAFLWRVREKVESGVLKGRRLSIGIGLED